MNNDEKAQTEKPKTKKISLKQMQKKKEKDWRKFLGFMSKNPEALMSLVEQPVPSICDAKSSHAGLATGPNNTTLECPIYEFSRTPNLYDSSAIHQTYNKMWRRPMSGKVIGRRMPITMDLDTYPQRNDQPMTSKTRMIPELG